MAGNRVVWVTAPRASPTAGPKRAARWRPRGHAVLLDSFHIPIRRWPLDDFRRFLCFDFVRHEELRPLLPRYGKAVGDCQKCGGLIVVWRAHIDTGRLVPGDIVPLFTDGPLRRG